MRVLIADDQKDVGTTLADLVTHCNHEVVGKLSLRFEAIQAYSRHRPDAVLMDYWMSRIKWRDGVPKPFSLRIRRLGSFWYRDLLQIRI